MAATYVNYTPSGIFAKALFNFDSIAGIGNFKYSGTVSVSVSAPFTFEQYLDDFSLGDVVYTDYDTGTWEASQLGQLDLITGTYSNFINLGFTAAADYSALYTALGVGAASNINVSIVDRDDLNFAGISALNSDTYFGYTQARGDVVINAAGVGGFDVSFGPYTYGFHTLMHEIGHSLGLSHPHSAWNGGNPTITTDYAATATVGFDKLGFVIDGPLDMYKEYFSLMSYDDQAGASYFDTFAQTPMILDVIALQSAYGAGSGSTGSGDDTITPGGDGGVDSYRTYFDTGGNDTIDLTNYSFVGGAYLHMGTGITGAAHRVGVSMSVEDADIMFSGGDPASLRWFYGEFENALGTSLADVLVGNSLANSIGGRAGNDWIKAGAGNDSIDGGAGNDTMAGGAGNDTYVLDSATDLVRESAGAGADGVRASFTYSLAFRPNIENAELYGTDPANLTGNGTANVLAGNASTNTLKGGGGPDRLYGGLGNDQLTGGEGADRFVFDSAPDATTNADTINDFAPGIDRIWLDDDVFGALGTVSTATILAPAKFFSGAAAHDGSDRVIYNPANGIVYYDADGWGVLPQTAIADIGAGKTITNTDFAIVA